METEDFQVDNVVVGDIQFAIEKNATEKVFFALNRFCNPEIFPLEGNNPRIVIDIKKVSSWNGRARIPVNGLLIKQVRTYFHLDQNKLRIVLDLNFSMDYVAVPNLLQGRRRLLYRGESEVSEIKNHKGSVAMKPMRVTLTQRKLLSLAITSFLWQEKLR
jgi:hypothetical protein